MIHRRGQKPAQQRSHVLQQIFSVWSALDNKRRITVVLATVAMFAAVLGLSRVASKPSMALLYAGLESSVAGDVVTAIEARGVLYEVRGASIFVDSSERDTLRMMLASDGLPSNSTQGYELLDSLSGFGTTSQMFDAAYWRAKEGELARTISANPLVRSARVHLANPSSQPFQRQARATASVTVNTSQGTLSGAQAQGIKFLVASAVAGLNPEDVSVIDGRGTLVDAVDGGTESSGDNSRAADMRSSVERMIEARVGKGAAVVEVSMEVVTERESFTERKFDPDSRVAISTDTEERTTSSNNQNNPSVTVASNLPANGADGGGSSSNNSETRERINYEVSEITREVTRAPGAIKRLSVAVLIDGIRSQDPTTGETVWAPRSEEELVSLRELVSSAVGLNPERGDTLTLKTMEFEPVLVEGTVVEASIISGLQIDLMTIIQLAVLSVVALVLGMFVIRPILSSIVASAPPKALPAPAAELPGLPAPGLAPPPPMASIPIPQPQAAIPIPEMPPMMGGGLPALNGEIDDNFAPPQMAVMTDFNLGDGIGGSDDPVARLRKMIGERQDETVEILRSWMEEEESV
jgi:flagellar M-ring protein FliF